MSTTEVRTPRPEYRAEAWTVKLDIAEELYQHRGPENAISSKELAERVLGDEDRDSTVRNYIDDVIEAFRLPVGNCEDGYFVIQSDDQFRRLMEQYESRRQSATERMRALSRAYYGEREVFGSW